MAIAAARISHGSSASDLANSAASPEYAPPTEAGMPISRSTDWMSLTASDSAYPGARSKLMVTEGNCSWCAMASGAEVGTKRAKAASGTCVLLVTALGVGGVLVLVLPFAVLP